jgi:hypothetical protein
MMYEHRILHPLLFVILVLFLKSVVVFSRVAEWPVVALSTTINIIYNIARRKRSYQTLGLGHPVLQSV